MKSTISIVFLFFLLFNSSFAQSYTVDSYQSTYEPLTEFTSVPLELLAQGEDYYDWEKEFQFGFDFPFFDTTHSSIFLDYSGYGIFEDSENYNLFAWAAEWIINEITDTSMALDSDVRYGQLEVNDHQVFVLEWKNNLHESSLIDNSTDHHANFQLWMHENGNIELHFGDINLDNCAYYFPGQGFSFDSDDPTGEIFGPWLGINNNDETLGAYFGGDHTTPDISIDDVDNAENSFSIPPSGFVVRFVPAGPSPILEVSDLPEVRVLKKDSELIAEGNLADYSGMKIWDLSGKLLDYTTNTRMNISNISAGLFIVTIETTKGIYSQKVNLIK